MLKPSHAEQKVLPVAEVAKIIKVSRPTLTNWRNSGRLKAKTKIGLSYCYDIETVLRFAASYRKGSRNHNK